MRVGVVSENPIERLALWSNAVPEPLMETQLAFSLARSIMAAVELGVFEAAAEGPKTAEEIAASCGIDAPATGKLLGALTASRYFTHRDGRFALTPKSRKWMLRSSPGNLCDKMIFQLREWDVLGRLEGYLRNGEPLNLHEGDADYWESYQRGMRSLSGLAAAEVTARLPLPAGARHMLDIGGSHGFYSVSLCRKHPALSSVIVDLPEAVAQAAPILAEEGMGERVAHRAGDALTDDLGKASVDLVFMAQLIHHFSEDQNRALAGSIARALRPGGICVVLDAILPETPGASGQTSAILDLYFSMTSRSGTWPLTAIHGWYEAAGLKPLKPVWLRSLPGGALVIGEKPR